MSRYFTQQYVLVVQLPSVYECYRGSNLIHELVTINKEGEEFGVKGRGLAC